MIHLLLIEDHILLSEGLRQIFASAPGITVSDQTADSREALNKIWDNAYDIALLDISHSKSAGLNLLEQIKAAKPKLPVLILNRTPDHRIALRAVKARACGLLTTSSSSDELLKAVHKVAQGGRYVSADFAEKLFYSLETDAERPAHECLSNREYQVMCAMASGQTLKEIGAELALSVKTISTYRARILEKMNMRSSAEIISYAIRNGLID